MTPEERKKERRRAQNRKSAKKIRNADRAAYNDYQNAYYHSHPERREYLRKKAAEYRAKRKAAENGKEKEK